MIRDYFLVNNMSASFTCMIKGEYLRKMMYITTLSKYLIEKYYFVYVLLAKGTCYIYFYINGPRRND